MRFGQNKNGSAMFHPEKAVPWTTLSIVLLANTVDYSEKLLERHLNVSFQFITIKIQVSNHDYDASEETVQIIKTPLECQNVVRYLKMIAFCYQ